MLLQEVKCIVLIGFCIFVLCLKEKHFKKESPFVEASGSVLPNLIMSPFPDLFQEAILSPISKISMFKTCSILTGNNKKIYLEQKAF